MTSNRRQFVMVFQVEQNHGSPQIVGRVCYLDADTGELRNPLGDRFEDGGEYADFAVTAYHVEGSNPRPWGFGYAYMPYRVETYRAEMMAKLLRKLDKSMERLNGERGYVRDGDFHVYALRVAESLGIRDFYVRNSEKRAAVSGETWRRTDGSGVQSWLDMLVQERLGGTSRV